MRHLGVVVGTTARHGNVLKIRPPLAFDESHVPILAGALADRLDPYAVSLRRSYGAIFSVYVYDASGDQFPAES
jgi:hypothetical protein